ncbi:MAG: leucine-rich repeat protein [Clostridia bacterium]|nr:leucine-rich repeat protein [Clostridia bacterium]
MKKSVKRIVCGALALAMASSLVLERVIRISADGVKTGESVSATATGASFTNVTGQFDTSKMVKENFNSSVMKTEDVAPTYETRTVLVTLSKQPLAERAEGEAVSSYAESWSGERALADIGAEQDSFLSGLSRRGISYELVQSYNTVLNGVAIRVNTKYLDVIREMNGVQSAFSTGKYSVPETVKNVKTTSEDGVITNQTSVYDTGIYDSSAYAEEYGEGTVVAILDTGLDYTHEAFQGFEHENVDVAWSKDYVKDMVENRGLSAEKRNGGLDVNDVYMNEKVPFAYDYADDDADVYPSFSNHGTHVAGIIGGYDTTGYTDKDGNPVDETFKGVVPDAQLVICKVFTDDLDDEDLGGAVPEDIIAALDDCVKLGVDVINMSLGTSCGFTTPNDEAWEGITLANVYERIQDAGITLVCAASNDYSSGYGGVYGTNLTSNPDSGTVGSPSTFSAALSVASINGQKASYFLANEGEKQSFVFYEESRDIDGNPYNFVEELTRRYGKTEFEYVVVGGVNSYGLGGVGVVSDYRIVQNKFGDSENPRIALVARGDNTFKEKVEVAQKMGAAAIIIYNNVSGTIRMNLGEIEESDLIPAISIGMNAGIQLVKAAGSGRVGTLKIDESFAAGPFMSEFSSWGPTHDLKLKPEITAHGGEITSTVPGGYGEQSGTSMASPNMAGFMALVRSYIKNDLGITDTREINRLAMQLTMSTAGMVYDQDGFPYSPRKQGAGVARLENVISGTQAYLYTDVEENDFRPKIELGDDPEKTGVYEMRFRIKNFGADDLNFTATHVAMTESASADGLTVSEQAHLLNKATVAWKVDGKTLSGDTITVGAGADVEISVTLTLDKSEKEYIDGIFENGMYVEGFLQLQSNAQNQCDLSIPFLGFYGDWSAAPMLDYSAFEIAENASDPAILEEDKIKASVWETLPYTAYYNDDYVLPMGGYVYLVDENEEPMYVSEEHCAVSRYNEYYGEGSDQNYLSSTSIRAVYTGLLRNARVVNYKMYNAVTGELVFADTLYNIAKAYSGGGSAVPSNVELRLSPEAMGLVAGGTYRMEFEFFQNPPKEGESAPEENTFEFSFTVDYEAPVLESANVRFQNYKENDKEKERIYLDLSIYDNHYPQAVMLCYPTNDAKGERVLQLATEYPTPVRNAVRNGTSKLSIEITDIYEKYGKDFYVQIDDYALNSCLYKIDVQSANTNMLPENFELAAGEDEVTLDIYQTHTVALEYQGDADLSNFSWTSAFPSIADVKNGVIVGLRAGSTDILVRNPKGETRVISVTVTENVSSSLPVLPSLSFGPMQTSTQSLTKAQGTVRVFAGEEFTLSVEKDPWYHPMTNLRLVWRSSNEEVATVDQNGNVKTLKKGNATITAMMERKDGDKWIETSGPSVSLRVQEEFTVSNYVLTDYNGVGWNEEIDLDGDGSLEKVLVVPTDMNIWYIGAGAFEDNNNIEYIVIPDSVIDIREYAFMNCTALRGVYFSDVQHREADGKVVNPDVDWAALAMVYEDAFYGCQKLEYVDLTNVKTITVAHRAFMDCVSLKQVIDMPSIGTMHHYAFANTALTEVDLTGLHMSGEYVFLGCNQIASVKTGKFTAIGKSMFAGCTALTEITLSTPKIGESAFADCVNLRKVTLDGKGENIAFSIGARAFENCGADGFEILFNGEKVREIGNRAFAGAGLKNIYLDFYGLETLGGNIFANTTLSTVTVGDGIDLETLQMKGAPFMGLTVEVSGDKYVKRDDVVYSADGSKILLADSKKTGAFTVGDEVQEIAPYAFANSGLESLVLGKNLQKIGEYAFYNSSLKSVVFAENSESITEIPTGAFYGSKVENITLPQSVTALGDYAFANSALSALTADGLTAVGSYAFEGCKALQTMSLTDGIWTMGDGVFKDCSALTSVTLPSVTRLGAQTFAGAKALTSVTFGAGATTIGDYTFYNTSVKTVDFNGANIQTIGDGAFYGATKVETVVLPESVTEIGVAAFYNAYSLRSINLENVVTIGDSAFYNSALKTLNLQSAKKIGAFAFGVEGQNGADVAGACTSLTMPVVEEIGAFAFLNTSISKLEIPASLREMGMGAFGSAANLALVSTAAENLVFFAEDNVLYRKVSDGEYELVLYPAARVAEGAEKAKTYEVKEGTVSVLAYAFYDLNDNVLHKVTLPYSMRLIGDSAFFASGVTEYEFKSIQAPRLAAEYREWIAAEIKNQASSSTTKSTYKGFYYANFEGYFFDYTQYGGQKSKLVLRYPENGLGYDNYVYRTYFGVKHTTGIAMEENTNVFVSIVDAIDLTELNAWLSWDTSDEDKKAEILAFSEQLALARLYCNNARESATQAQYATAERLDKLEKAEKLVREVKAKFNVFVGVKELKIATFATYKKEYREGETFDGTGLIALLIYDDGSQTELSVSELTLDEKYTQPLKANTQYVRYFYGEQSLIVRIKVIANEQSDGEEESAPAKDEKTGCGSEMGLSAATLGLLGAAVLLKRKKREN